MRVISFDTETYLIAPGRLAPPMVCLSHYDGVRNGLVLRDEGLALVRKWLLDDGVFLGGQNVPFDLGVVAQADPELLPAIFDKLDKGLIWDCQTMCQLVDNAAGRLLPVAKPSPYSLEKIVERELGEHVTGKSGDAWRYKYRTLEGVPVAQWPKEARDYALNDAVLAWRLFAKLNPQMPAKHDSPAGLASQLRAAWALHLCSAWGVRIDPASVDELERGLHRTLDKSIAWLTGVVYRPNGTLDTKAVQARVLAALGERTPRTPKGNIKKDKDTLAECASDPYLVTLGEISADKKLLSTYVPLLREGTRYPLNPSYDILKETSRVSSFGPNIQNQPRKPGVRECFVARPGYVLIACDYSIAELRSLAALLLHMYGASEMANAIIAGKDLHTDFASYWVGRDYAEMLAAVDAEEKTAKDARQIAKAGNFGFPGGMGAERFLETQLTQARSMNGGRLPDWAAALTLETSSKLREAWLARYPEMQWYFRDVSAWVASGGGRFTDVHAFTEFVRGGCSYCQGANQGFQHITATGTKRACWDFQREAYLDKASPVYGSRLWAMIHDELIIETPEANGHEAATRLQEIMIAAMEPYTPGISAVAEAAMMRVWSKKAKPVFEDGRLVVWNRKRAQNE